MAAKFKRNTKIISPEHVYSDRQSVQHHLNSLATQKAFLKLFHPPPPIQKRGYCLKNTTSVNNGFSSYPLERYWKTGFVRTRDSVKFPIWPGLTRIWYMKINDSINRNKRQRSLISIYMYCPLVYLDVIRFFLYNPILVEAKKRFNAIKKMLELVTRIAIL